MKTSQSARSSASSAASPPRAKSATPGPTRPPSFRSELLAGAQQAARPLGLELEQPPQRLVRLPQLGDAEAPPVFGRQVHAPQREVARHVLQEVHQLQAGADVVGERNQLGLVVRPSTPSTRRPTGSAECTQ